MAAICTLGVWGGCGTSVLLTEHMSKWQVKGNPMDLLTIGTFVFGAVYIALSNPQVVKQRRIPLSEYAVIALIFLVTNVLNNQAVYFDLPFPLYIIFRSGTLLATVLLSSILQRRVYTVTQILSAFLVTTGLVIFTYSNVGYQHPKEIRVDWLWVDIFPWSRFTSGILALSACILMSAYMGIRQEIVFTRYGKHSDEMMFHVNLFIIPYIFIVWPSTVKTIASFNQFPPISLMNQSLGLPSSWLVLTACIAFQTLCIRCVYKLTSVTSVLSVNMILAIRKFLNLFLSALLFGNEFGPGNIIGSLLVIVGSCMFYDSHRFLFDCLKRYKGTKKYQ